MSHEILGNMFAGAKPGWHRIGHVYGDEGMTAEQAAKACGADTVKIGVFPIGAVLPDGSTFPLSDRLAIMRYPLDPAVIANIKDEPAYASLNTKRLDEYVRLGECSKDYTVIQNAELVKALDKSGLSTRWRTETIGVLSEGAGIFICLNMGVDQIAGEDHVKYLLISDKRDGRSGMLVKSVWTRVVCANTLAVAESENSDINIVLSHGSSLQGDFEFSIDLMHQVEEQSATVKAKLEALLSIRVDSSDVPGLLEATYPTPQRGGLLKQYDRIDDPSRVNPTQLGRLQRLSEQHTYDVAANKVIRTVCGDQFERLGREYPHLADNGLGFVNAVAAVADHTRNRGATMPGIDGYKAEEKIRGYKALIALAN